MSDIFISYARSTATQAQQVAAALRRLGYSVWIDDDLPAHRNYSRVIEEQMAAAKAAVVLWSADAVNSEWVLSEANRAREDRKLVQAATEQTRLPMPFDTIQCADLKGWTGDLQAPGWRKMLASLAELVGAEATPVEAPPALPLPRKPSIAVMPFANLSGDPDQDYFADGMVEEITNALSRIKSIFVIASGSGLSFKNKAVGPRDVSRQLGVRYVLEGSVRRAGGRVRIAVRLVDGADGAQLWSEQFDDTLEDVFALQDRVALAVAGKIEPTVQMAEIRRAADRPTDNIGSYDLYLRAVPIFRSFTKASALEAFGLLERAIELDPDNGPALSLAAICHYQFVAYGWSAEPEASRRTGVELAHRALRAAPDDAYVLALGASVAGYLEGDLATAVTLADRAIALNPGSALARMSGGIARTRNGEVDLAVDHIQAAIRLDPLGPDRPIYTSILGLARFYQGHFADAVALGQEAKQQIDGPLVFAFLAVSYGHLGRTAEAQAALADFRRRAQAPIEDFPLTFSRKPSHLKLFLDGVALAEGKSPAGAESPP